MKRALLLAAWWLVVGLLAPGVGAQSAVVEGRIVSAAGDPAVDFRVSLCPVAIGYCSYDPAFPYDDTDADGRFRIAAGDGAYVLLVDSDPARAPLRYAEGSSGQLSRFADDATTIELSSPTSLTLDLTLPAGYLQTGIVSGRLLYADGQPIEHVTVQICRVEWDECIPAWTGGDGRFARAVEPGAIYLLIGSASIGWGAYHEESPGFRSSDREVRTEFQLAADEVREINVTVPVRVGVTGLVQTADGDFAEHVEILLCNVVSRICLLEQEGGGQDTASIFQFFIGDAEYDLQVFEFSANLGIHRYYYSESAPGQLSRQQSQRTLISHAGPRSRHLELTLPETEPVASRASFDDLSLPAWAGIEGRVQAHIGTPLAGLTVRACALSIESCLAATTDESGRFSIDAIPFTYRDFAVEVTTPQGVVGHYTSDQGTSFTFDQAQRSALRARGERRRTIPITLPFGAGMLHPLSGLIEREEGEQPSDLSLRACAVGRRECFDIEIGDDHRFTAQIPESSYRLEIRGLHDAPVYHRAGSLPVIYQPQASVIDVPGDQASDLVIQLPAFATITGRVHHADGRPAAGLRTSLCPIDDGICLDSLTDADGGFRLTAPVGRRYVLRIAESDQREGYYSADAEGRFSTVESDRTTILLVKQSAESIAISLPAESEPVRTSLYPIAGVIRHQGSSTTGDVLVRACEIDSGDCVEVPSDQSGNFALTAQEGVYRLEIVVAGESAGFYWADAASGYSTTQATEIHIPRDQAMDIDVLLPLTPGFSGQVRYLDGRAAADTTVSVCREEPQADCEQTRTDANGRFSLEVPFGQHYIAFTLDSNERWYYHADSPGRLIGTDRRPERTFVTAPSAQASDIAVRIPEREFVRLVLNDQHRGPELNATVEVSICREDWDFDSFLPQCLIPTETDPPAGADRALRAPVPPEPYYISFRFTGYAVGDSLWFYYDEDSSTGLSSDWLRRTTFTSGSVPTHPLPIRLPDLPRSIPIRLELNPGVNLVGWPGGNISLRELARQIPELKGVVRFTLDSGAPVRSYSVDSPNAPAITSLSRWWFYVDLDEPRTVHVDTAPDPAAPHPYGGYHHWLMEGESLLVWAGAQTATIEQATAGLGELREPPRLVRWTGTKLARLETGLVRQGDIILVDSPLGVQTRLPYPWRPAYVLNGPADDEWGQIAQRVEAVQAFFWERYGLIHNRFTLHYRTSTEPYPYSWTLQGRCGWSGPWTITLTCADPHSIARQYFRMLQLQILSFDSLLRDPAWLIEGMMEYAAAEYTHQAEGQSGDPLDSYRETVRSGSVDRRDLTELPGDVLYWGDDRAATMLSALAIDWLIKHSGNQDALFEFHRRTFDHSLIEYANEDPGNDWRLAFEETFDISVDDFYERFAEYRANGFRTDGE